MNCHLLVGSIALFPESNLSVEEILLWSYILFFISIVSVVFVVFRIIKLHLDRSYYRKCDKEHQRLIVKITRQMEEISEKVKRANCHQRFFEESVCQYYSVEELLIKHASDTQTNNLAGALEILQTLSPIMDELEKIADSCIVSHEEELGLLRWGDESPIS